MRLILCCFSFLFVQCHSQKNFMGTTLILKKDQTAEIKEISASFKLQSCGRKYLMIDGKSAGERAYCNLIATYKGKQLYFDSEQPLFFEIYQAVVTGINPWGVEERGIPANGCKVEVKISPAISFLQQYHWDVDSIVNEQKFTLPETFTGIPWYHYAAATKQINFNLETLHGKTVQLQKLQLKEKGKRSGKNFWAHIVIIDGKAITGWLSASVVAPGIAPLNMEKSKLSNW